MLSTDALIGDLASEQYGHFTTAQALSSGATKVQIVRRVRSGVWIPVHRGVFRIAGIPRSWKGDLLAACLAGGDRAYASGRSAAALHGLPGGRTDIVEMTCPRWLRTVHHGLVVHERCGPDPRDIRRVDGIPVSRPECTLLELAARFSPRLVDRAFHAARRQNLVSWESCVATLGRLARRGRPGVRKLRQVLEQYGPRDRPTESEMETLLLHVLRENDFPEPELQYVVRDAQGRFVARVDAALVPRHVALEYDSKQEHSSEAAIAADNARRNRLLAAGWMPISVRFDDLKAGGPEFRAAIRGATDLLRHPSSRELA